MTDLNPVDAMTTDYRALCDELVDVVYGYCILHEGRDHLQPLVDRARALLDQPEPEEEDCPGCEGTPVASNSPCAVCGRAVLARWGHPTPQPVAVSERLPSAAYCDAEGRCWWYRYTPTKEWHLQSVYIGQYNYWLPANALPTPELEALDD